MGNEPGEISKDSKPQDAENVILDNARRLLNSNQSEPFVIHASHQGLVPTEDILKIIKQAEQLSLSSAEAGDVVWWKTESETTGYFRIDEPYTDDGEGLSGMKSGNGKFLISRKESHPLGDQRGSGYILGAKVGSGLTSNSILKGAQLEYFIEKDGASKKYTTTPVTEIGVIKAESLIQK